MVTTLRESTLKSIGLGTALDIFRQGRLPADPAELVDRVFGKAGERGALVVSGASGIVGAGKTMQLGSRLESYGVPIVALDVPGAPNGLARQYPGLVRTFGRERADRIAANIIQLTYDGKELPSQLRGYRPRFLLEAIPEILELKKAHYAMFRKTFPDIEIRSVTSGFPSSQLGVGIAHPAFPHEVNKVWEIVEPTPSPITHLLWSLGLIPVPVGDNWSFVLDVLFCGLTLAGLRVHQATNMPFWKLDKFIRRLVGPNPFRAHDAIGARGADFLTWSCLHHLSQHYGDVFKPTAILTERKDSGLDWYPPNHFRPMVNWSLDAAQETEFNTWILGSLFQMTSLMIHENRASFTHINAMGELCAQLRRGIMAILRSHGPERARKVVEAYHKLHPEAAKKSWYPEVFEKMGTPEWQQLYVNAEAEGTTGVITFGRESYNADVDAELNRAIDWLKTKGVKRVIVSGDFHLSTQLVGADTNEFFPALTEASKGYEIAANWTKTARRLNSEFEVSVGFIGGKRALGGMLELMEHCHYLVAVESAELGMPEVTLPVVPGMEGCHWPFRKTTRENWPKLLKMQLEGKPVKAKDAVGWLIDFAGPMDKSLQAAWKLVSGGDHGLRKRALAEGKLDGIPTDVPGLAEPENPGMAAGRKAIFDCIRASCGVPLSEALALQAKLSADFMTSPACKGGTVGDAASKAMSV